MPVCTKRAHFIFMLFVGILNLYQFVESLPLQSCQQPTPDHPLQDAMKKAKRMVDNMHMHNVLHRKIWMASQKLKQAEHDPKLLDRTIPKYSLPDDMTSSTSR